MILHSDTLTMADMYDATRPAHVGFISIDEKGSRTRHRSFKFLLEGYVSNRRPNWGTGARDLHDGFAATWDEWGIFLNVLFQRDPEAHVTGSYLGLEGFRHQTGNRFDTLTHAEQHVQHTWRGNGCTGCFAERWFGNPEGLVLVKHGILRPTDTESVESWLAKTA